MKIAIVSASGRIGSRLVNEALERGHNVTAIVRHPEKVMTHHAHLTVVQGDALNVNSLTEAIRGHEVVISAYSPGFMPTDDQSLFSTVAHNLIEATKQSGVSARDCGGWSRQPGGRTRGKADGYTGIPRFCAPSFCGIRRGA